MLNCKRTYAQYLTLYFSVHFVFRFPVDELEYPDYNKYVTSPMCFNDIMEQFKESNLSPKQIYDDLEMIVSNSRKFNTNTDSEVSCEKV